MTAPTAAGDGHAFDAFERRGWIAAARAYDDVFTAITSRVIDPLLDAVEAAPGDGLLDLACGPGHLLAAAGERGVRAVGVDASPAMVELAQRTAPTATVRWSDAQHLTFADHSFEAVTAAFVLMHVARPEQVVAEAARVLRPGGRLGVAVWDQPDRARLFGWVLEAIDAAGATSPSDLPEGPSFFAYADDEAMASLLEQGGLTDMAVRTVEFTHHAGSVADIWRGLIDGTVRTSALLRGQDPATLERIREAFASYASPHADAGGVGIPFSVKLGVGVLP